MLDHVLGRPSVKSRRLQVLAVLTFWLTYIVRGHKNGPPGLRTLSRFLSKKLTAWQMVVLTMTYLYAARNFSTLVGLGSPDPLTNMYEATFFRATWMLTALDAGFWTAMRIRAAWLRNIASLVFSGFYLIAAEQADEKVRKVRGNLTVEHLRVSWNKGTTPYLHFLQGLMGPRLTRWPPRRVRIQRPPATGMGAHDASREEPVMAWLYYDGSIDSLRASGIDRVILDIPGGGFVAMDPRCNDERLFSWAVQTGLPVLSLDYRKAPEYPFPYALYECHDAYTTLVQTRGRCIGLAGQEPVRVVVTGDSAGGNLAAAMTLMVAQEGLEKKEGDEKEEGGGQARMVPVPVPDGLVLMYPSLDMNIGSWMSDEQMALIQDRRLGATTKNVIRRKTNQYSDIAGTPHESDEEEGLLRMTAAVPKTKSIRFGGTRRAGDVDDERGHDGDVEGDGDGKEEGDDNSAAAVRWKGDDARRPKPAYSHVNIASFDSQALQEQPRTPTVATLTATGMAGGSGSGSGSGRSSSSKPVVVEPGKSLQTRLATSSTISYFNDRVLTPEMMRAMILLYVGPHNRPDFSRDYLLSPILAPDLLLAQFPKTYFLTGERDPLVDDTVIFAGRLRRIQAALRASGGRRMAYRESDAYVLAAEHPHFDDRRDVAEVVLVPGVSHGFLQFPALYPAARKWFARGADWIEDAFRQADEKRRADDKRVSAGKKGMTRTPALMGERVAPKQQQQQQPSPPPPPRTSLPPLVRTESSGDEGQPLEMMMMTKPGKSSSSSNNSNSSSSMMTTPEMEGPSKRPGSNTSASTGSPTEQEGGEEEEEEEGLEEDKNGSHRTSKTAKKKRAAGRGRGGRRDDKQLTKLASSDDLLGRRMKGIVGGLTGLEE